MSKVCIKRKKEPNLVPDIIEIEYYLVSDWIYLENI